MRILQIIHKPQNRGAETFACQLSNHLVRLGHEVQIVSLYEGNAKLPYTGEILSLGASLNSSFINRSSWKKLADIINSYKPDVVQANSGDTLKYAVLSKITFGWRNPLISRNASEVGRYLNSAVQRAVNSFFYKHVDHVISVSKASEIDFIKHFPLLKGKTEVIGVGLEEESLSLPIKLEPEHGKHIVHVGGFSFEKNHSGLLSIFKKVIETEPKVHLHLVGDGDLQIIVRHKVKEMKLDEKITFHGFIDNPLPLIQAADVLVLPSIIEGLPGVLLEAMYCKTPVIAYNVGGISEIINTNTGYLIPKNDEDDFAEKTVKILKCPSKEQLRVDNARQLVLESYMNKQLALQFLGCYQKVLNR